MSKRIWCVALIMMMAMATLAQQASVIKEIVITGNVRVSKEAILAAMRTKVGQPYVQAQLDQDKESLGNLGFFQAVDIQAKALDTNNWQVLVNVQEWPVVKEIRIVGNKAVSTADIMKVVTIKPGEVFNLRTVRPNTDAINKLYTAKGYFARIEEFAPLRDSPQTLNIVIVELKVNSVKAQGNHRTSQRIMSRLIKTRAGDTFSTKKWEADLRRLYGTQWFENVRSIENGPDENFGIDLIADVKEQRTGNFGVGLQVDPRSSFAGFIRLSDTNYRGTGQSVGVNFLQATTGGGPSIDLDYGNPFIDNKDTSFNVAVYSRLVYRFQGTAFGGSSTPTSQNRYYERHTGSTIGVARPVSDQTYASLNLRAEGIKTAGLSTSNTNDFIQQDGNLAILGLGFTRNRRDVDIEPSRGDWATAEISPGYADITKVGGAGNVNGVLGRNFFNKTFLEYRRYWSPGQPPRDRNKLDEPRRVVAARVRYGMINGTTPFFEQFFVGGSETLRGYQEDRFWGKQMFLATLEYRRPLQKSFNIVGFVDYGGAWGGYPGVNTFTQGSKINLHVGYGVGLSFRTPLGPIRLDLGFNERGNSRTHFLIGTSF